jgi:hypothetical protein
MQRKYTSSLKCRKNHNLMTANKPRCRWEDNIKMDLRGIGINEANWIRLAQDRVQWRDFEYGNEHSGSIKKAGYSSDKRSDNLFFK